MGYINIIILVIYMQYERIKLDYTSLEPYIDNKTLDLHYNAHYKGYTDNLNKYLKKHNYNYEHDPIYLAKNIDILPMEDRDEILFKSRQQKWVDKELWGRQDNVTDFII